MKTLKKINSLFDQWCVKEVEMETPWGLLSTNNVTALIIYLSITAVILGLIELFLK